MDGNKPGMPRFFMLFLFVKLVLGNFSNEQSSDIQDSTGWKREKVKTEEREVRTLFVPIVCCKIVGRFYK